MEYDQVDKEGYDVALSSDPHMKSIMNVLISEVGVSFI